MFNFNDLKVLSESPELLFEFYEFYLGLMFDNITSFFTQLFKIFTFNSSIWSIKYSFINRILTIIYGITYWFILGSFIFYLFT